MRSDPTGFTRGRELVERQRLLKCDDPDDELGPPPGIFLELWEKDDNRAWSIALLDDYRSHLGEGIHFQIDDEEAGILKREYMEVEDATDA